MLKARHAQRRFTQRLNDHFCSEKAVEGLSHGSHCRQLARAANKCLGSPLADGQRKWPSRAKGLEVFHTGMSDLKLSDWLNFQVEGSTTAGTYGMAQHGLLL